MHEIIDPLNEIAKKKFNIDYIFPYQRLVISNILNSAKVGNLTHEVPDEDNTSPHQIVLLPTGAGKSLCFMIPSILLEGLTLVIFPLLSLIADQQRRLEESGIKSVVLRGGQTLKQRKKIFDACRSGTVKMILTNPETAITNDIADQLNTINIVHLVIDETHTVSEWGDSFRPAYLQMHKLIKSLDIELVTAFTATASPHILQRIKEIIFPDSKPNIVYANPDRPNISYHVIKTSSPRHTLIEQVKNAEKPLIVFSSSRTGTELTARLLRHKLETDDVFFYHAGLSREEKASIESWFFESDNGILVATTAYGMGVDKSGIRTVIHIDLPSTVESYLQESGRGGRDRKPAKAILIYSSREIDRLSKVTDPLARNRFSAMINYALKSTDCRRETLLAMLNSEPEICSGCDVCDNSVYIADDESAILSILHKNRRRFTVKEALYFFKGFKSREVSEKQFHRIKYFGILNEWDTDSIRETLDILIREKKIRIIRSPIWKGLITDQSHMYGSVKSFLGSFHQRLRQ